MGRRAKVERNAAMAADYRAGLSLLGLADKYGMSTSCAVRIMRREGVTMRPRGRRPKVADQATIG